MFLLSATQQDILQIIDLSEAQYPLAAETDRCRRDANKASRAQPRNILQPVAMQAPEKLFDLGLALSQR